MSTNEKNTSSRIIYVDYKPATLQKGHNNEWRIVFYAKIPTQNEFIDWTTKVSPDDTKGKKKGDWLAFGWGDKGFYLNTPTWADLKFSTAVKAAFWMR